MPLILRELPAPKCLHRSAIHLIQDRLAKGCIHRLARRGGWRPGRFLRGDRIAVGRLWQRTPPAELALHFSGQTIRFLIWLTAHKPGRDGWSAAPDELTVADLLLLHFAYGALRDTAVEPVLRQRDCFQRHALVRLAYPQDFDARGGPADFAPWLTGVGAVILETLQPELAANWLALEARKKDIADGQPLRELGQRQVAVLEPFLDAVEQAGRLDLARFLIDIAGRLLTPDADRQRWIHPEIDAGASLAERQQTYQAGLALVRQVERFQKWDQRARAIGYFDEGYAAAQLFKEDWEQLQGDATVQPRPGDLAGNRSAVRSLTPRREQP